MTSVLRFLGNLLRTALFPLWLLVHRTSRPKERWVEVRLGEHPVEIDGAAPLMERLLRRGTGRTLRSITELRSLLDRMAGDDRIEGLLLHISHLRCGFATCQSLRELLTGFRARGKRVVVYMQQGGGNREFYVALAADRVLCAPQASFSLLGAGSQMLYFKPLLDRLGIEADVLAVGEYKTAAEPLLREVMSEPQREQLGALLAIVQGELERAVAERPGFDAERACAVFARGFWGAAAAEAAGLIDGCCYEDQLPAVVAGPAAAPARTVRSDRYLAWRLARLWRRVRPLPQVAVVRVHGTIMHGTRSLPGSRSAGVASVVAALRRARASRRVQAVLLHVDSPGGSSLASDLIHREIVRVREKKPIVAYLGDVAASGGYLVAAPCQRIVAQSTTITGSIGVISVRFLARLLAERVGVRQQVVRAAPHADLDSPFRGLEPDERAVLKAEVEAIYDGFVKVVADGRNRPREEIEPLARGRVWSGADAVRLGLADELGSMERALSVLRELAPGLRGLNDEQIQLKVYRAAWGETPAVDPKDEATAWGGVRAQLPSEIRDALSLFQSEERALYYSLLPELW